MPRPPMLPPTVAVRVVLDDAPGALPAVADAIAVAGGTVRTMSTVKRLAPERDGAPPGAELEVEVEGIEESALVDVLAAVSGVRATHLTRALDRVFGKRVIVVGGGAQV